MKLQKLQTVINPYKEETYDKSKSLHVVFSLFVHYHFPLVFV